MIKIQRRISPKLEPVQPNGGESELSRPIRKLLTSFVTSLKHPYRLCNNKRGYFGVHQFLLYYFLQILFKKTYRFTNSNF